MWWKHHMPATRFATLDIVNIRIINKYLQSVIMNSLIHVCTYNFHTSPLDFAVAPSKEYCYNYAIFINIRDKKIKIKSVKELLNNLLIKWNLYSPSGLNRGCIFIWSMFFNEDHLKYPGDQANRWGSEQNLF